MHARTALSDAHRSRLCFALMFIAAAGIGLAEPVTPDASQEARALLRAINRISGRNTLSGQHNLANDDLAELGEGIPIALGEVGGVPTPAVLKNQMKWAWFMVWADLLKVSKLEAVRELFDDPHTLSRGEKLP